MAVYTHLTHAELAAWIARDYALGPLISAEGIAQGVSNSNYRIVVRGADGGAQTFILTLYETRTDPRDVPFFLELMQYLASCGIACPQPITRRDGWLFGELASKPAAIISFLQGESRDTWDAAHVGAVGATLAALHRAGNDFSGKRANALSHESWRTFYKALRGGLDGIEPGLDALMADELTDLEEKWPGLQTLPRGIIHADLFPDNVFFAGDAVSGVIDFYFACTDFLAYDIAVTLNAWCFGAGGMFDAAKASALFAGYQRTRPLTPEERAAFPTLARGAAMRFLMTRAYDLLNHPPGALVTPHDPHDYIRRLEFHRHVHDISEYGF